MTRPIEPWKLTAFTLGELTAEEAEQVRAAMGSDRELQRQQEEMEEFIVRLQSVFENVPDAGSLSEERTSAIVERMGVASDGGGEASSVDGLRELRPRGVEHRYLRSRLIGLLAFAASLLWAVLLIPMTFQKKEDRFAIRSMDEEELSEQGQGLVSQLAQRIHPNGSREIVVVPLPLEPMTAGTTSPAEQSGEGGDRVPRGELAEGLSKPITRFTVPRSYRLDEAIVGQVEMKLHPTDPLAVAATTPTNEGELLALDLDTASADESKANAFFGNSYDAARGISQKFRFVPGSRPLGEGDRYEVLSESPFVETAKSPLSTFSIDVDTASYSKIRQYLIQAHQLPIPDAVRIEEMVNYFEYDYAGPRDEHPFASHMAVQACPWNEDHQLVRIGLQAKKIDIRDRAKANLVFLLDVSGSMDEPNKLPLVKQAMSLLIRQLGENDRLAIVVYAGAAGCVLPSITGDKQAQILAALEELNAGGSTNGGEGIALAYSIAREHFIPGGINRVILCTDGDFNVGVTSNEALIELVREQAKSQVFLTCLGFGIGNYNDSMMEQITNQGNGLYGMVDNPLEARRIMIEQLSGTLITVAKDVKIQVEFNPAKIASYRLIGYENRRLAHEDFNNDKKDAGEIGAGHCVTALYEIVPVGVASAVPAVDDLRYGRKKEADSTGVPRSDLQPGGASDRGETFSDEWLTLKLRYKQPEAEVSSKIEFFLTEEAVMRSEPDEAFRWATAVAEFGLLLRKSPFAPQADWGRMIERARSAIGSNPYRIECLEMMSKAKALSGN